MKKILHILSDIPSFSGLSENQLEEIKQIIVDRQSNKDRRIFSKGYNSNGFYGIVGGMVKISKVSLEGKEDI